MTMLGEVALTLFYMMIGFFVIAASVAGFIDWLNFHNNQHPEERDFAKASHGAGIIALYVLLTGFPFGDFFWLTRLRPATFFIQAPSTIGALSAALQRHPDNWRNWIPVVVFGWGIFWLCIGWRRAPRFRDGHKIMRALIKIAAGVFAVCFAAHGVGF